MSDGRVNGRRRWAGLASLVVLVAAAAVPGFAQAPAPGVRTPRFELGIGGGLNGRLSLGERAASLRGNGSPSSAYQLFATESRLSPAAAIELRVGYRLANRFVVEGRATAARPWLRSALTADVENAASVEAQERATEYVIDGGVSWRVRAATGRSWSPFVSGGGGLARYVHEARAFAENAPEGYVGAGAVYARGRRAGGSPRAGLRADVRLQLVGGGIVAGAGVSPRVTVSAGAFLVF